MAGPLTWILELYDKVSAPAEKMTKATEKFEKQMHKAAGSIEKAHHAQKELSAERIAIMSEVAREGVRVFEELTEKVVEFGMEMLHAADAHRSNLLIFESLAGSAERGAELFEKAEEYAEKAGIKNEEAFAIFRTLAKGNVKDVGENFFILAQAAGDLSARTGIAATSIADSFAKIVTKNQLASHELRGLAELGVPVQLLAKHLGVTANNSEELGKALGDRKLSGQQALQGFISALQELEGGRIGQLRKSLGEGFAGAADRLGNAWEKALAAFSETEGFKRILDLMDRITARLRDPAFVKGLSEIASAIAKIADGLERLLPSMETLSKTAKVFGLLDVKGEDSNAVKLGRNITGGVAEGLVSNIPVVGGAAVLMWEGLHDKMRGPEGADAHSPSRKMVALGKDMADGLELGLSRSHIDDALSLVPDRTRVPAGGPTSSSGHVEVHQEFNIHGSGTLDLEQLAHRIAEISASALQSPLENLSISLGTM